MNRRYVVMLIGGIIGAGIISFISGEPQWGLLIGIIIGLSAAEWRTKGRKKKCEVEMDERVENNIRKFISSAFGLSNILLLIYLIVCDMVLNQQFVKVRYLIYYLLATFFICFFVGPAIMKRR